MARVASQVGLCAYVDSLVAKLRKLAPVAADGADVEAVHVARVVARRIKAALDLLAPLVDQEEFAGLGKGARRVRRRLGDLRDLDVMLMHLRGVSRSRRHAGACVWLMGRLTDRRAAAVKRLRKKASAEDWIERLSEWKRLRPVVAGLGDAVERAMRASLSQQIAAFCGQADRLCAQMLDSLFEQERDPHAVRIAGKQLRYTLEMLAKSGERPADAAGRLFKRMQDALGLWHDFVVLTDHAMREAAKSGLGHRDPALESQVLKLAELTLKRSEQHLRRFAILWRENREVVCGLEVK